MKRKSVEPDLRSGILFRSSGVWLMWASYLTCANQGSYKVAIESYGGFSMIRHLLSPNLHRFGDHIFHTLPCPRLLDETLRAVGRHNYKHRNQCLRHRPFSPLLASIQLPLMSIAVLFDLWTLAKGLLFPSKGRLLFARGRTSVFRCLLSYYSFF